MKTFKIIIICIISSVFSFNCLAMTQEQKAKQLCFMILLYQDYKQTSNINFKGGHCEGNKILGKFPSQKEIDLYFLTSAALHTSISYILPEKYVDIWQNVTIFIQTKTINNNYIMQNKEQNIQFKFEYNIKF